MQQRWPSLAADILEKELALIKKPNSTHRRRRSRRVRDRGEEGRRPRPTFTVTKSNSSETPVGALVIGKVVSKASFGVFLDIGDGVTGLLHGNEMSQEMLEQCTLIEEEMLRLEKEKEEGYEDDLGEEEDMDEDDGEGGDNLPQRQVTPGDSREEEEGDSRLSSDIYDDTREEEAVELEKGELRRARNAALQHRMWPAFKIGARFPVTVTNCYLDRKGYQGVKISLSMRSPEEVMEAKRLREEGITTTDHWDDARSSDGDGPREDGIFGQLFSLAGIQPGSFSKDKNTTREAPRGRRQEKVAGAATRSSPKEFLKGTPSGIAAGPILNDESSRVQADAGLRDAQGQALPSTSATGDSPCLDQPVSSGRSSAAEHPGVVWSFVHGSKIGVLLELGCGSPETATREEFRTLAGDLAMQIAANKSVTVVSVADVPAEELESERRIESEKEDLLKKPEKIR